MLKTHLQECQWRNGRKRSKPQNDKQLETSASVTRDNMRALDVLNESLPPRDPLSLEALTPVAHSHWLSTGQSMCRMP